MSVTAYRVLLLAILEAHMYMWQSQIEIEYYFVAYFERITEFDAL